MWIFKLLLGYIEGQFVSIFLDATSLVLLRLILPDANVAQDIGLDEVL